MKASGKFTRALDNKSEVMASASASASAMTAVLVGIKETHELEAKYSK